MNAKLDHYRLFYYVAKNLSFSKAAKELFMTQSAVSQGVKNLENQLSTSLFIRGKSIQLTGEGRMLYEYVSSALALFDTAEGQLKKIHLLQQGELRIGVGDTVSRYYLLPVLEEFHQIYPTIKLKILNRVSRETVELLKNGKIDLAFVNLPLKDDGIEIHKSLEIHDVFVASHFFAELKDRKLTLNEVAELPLVMLEEESNSRNYVDAYFLANGVALHPEIELGSHDLLLDFAKSHLGVSCVIREFAEGILERNDVFELMLEQEIPARNIGICKRKSATIPPAAEVFLQLLL